MIELAELKIPQAVRPYADRIVAATDAACLEHLDEEYADLCRRLVGKLARKRPSPLARGDLGIWAAGVVCAIAQLNFLFDQSGPEPASSNLFREASRRGSAAMCKTVHWHT